MARGAGAALLGRAGGIIELISTPLYVWMFGLSTYGLYAVLWAAVNLIENVADLGMTSALQRTVPQTRTEAEAVAALRAALLLGVTPCLLIAALISFLAPTVATLVNVAAADREGLATGIRLFAWALPLWAFVEISTSALRAKRAFGPEIRLRLIGEQVIRLGAAVLLWAVGVDTLALL
ncbi:MAG TPA: oligosaccharide flippase family protein, partial [Sphingomonadaceae bacterium]|nr:oligosaccharide flippase family protein [Sphingomonadaceae bacterium]